MIRGVTGRGWLVAMAATVALVFAAAGARAAAETDPLVREAETALRLEIEQSATRIQRAAASGVNSVMSTRPATSSRLRNAIRAATNAIGLASREEIARITSLLSTTVDSLTARGVDIVAISRLSEEFDTEAADRLRALSTRGSRDVSGLVRYGNRTPSVRGTSVGQYDLFVSLPLEGRGPVKLGVVTLGESQLIRGAVSVQAATEFFLAKIAAPTPLPLPETTTVRALRWLNRGGTMSISAAGSASQAFAPLDSREFAMTGVDLLPARLRIELERRLEGSPEIAGNPRGADGFFESVTYTFVRRSGAVQ